MSFSTTQTILAANVANLGTFTVAYPAGSNAGDFIGGVDHRLIVGQREFKGPVDFTIAFGVATATITWKGGFGLTAGQSVRLQFDKAGEAENGINRAWDMRTLRIDLGMPIAAATASIRALAAIAGAGDLAASLLPAGMTADVPRNVTVTSSGAEAGLTLTFTGTDEYGVTLTETITAGATTTVAGKKAFKTVTGVTASAVSVANISLGWGTVLGLPIYVPVAGFILQELTDNAAATAGTKTAALPVNTVSTAITADVRGTWTPAGAQAPNGARAYSLIVLTSQPTFKGVPQA